MKRRILWCGLSFLLVASLVLASCGEAAPGEQEEEEPEVGEPQYGGTLTLKIAWCAGGTDTWDTSDLRGVPAHTWTSPYGETLLIGDIEKYGPRGTNEYGFQAWELVPEPYLKGCLAESWEWTDPMTLVYEIREGVMWTGREGVMDARELTADDIAYSMNRTWGRMQEQGNVIFDYLDTITATDRYTLVLEFGTFYADWAFHMGYRGIIQAIYPPEVVAAGASDWQNAVGTGPFILTDYVEDAQATYEKNPNYWGTATINGEEYELPFIDKLVWPIIPDESTALAALRTGKTDWQVYVPYVYADTLADTAPDLIQTTYLRGQTDFAALKTTQPPFDDRNVRRALMIGTDWETILNSVYLEGENPGGPMTSQTPFFTPMDELPESARVLYSNDPDLAAQMLADAGHPDGFKMKMHVHSNALAAQDIIALLMDQWLEFNVELEMVPTEGTLLSSMVSGRGTDERPGDYEDSCIMTMANATPWICFDRMALIESWKDPARFDEPYFNEGFAEAKVTRDYDELVDIITDLNLYLLEEVPYLVFPCAAIMTAYWPWVKNFYGEVECAYYNFKAQTSLIWIDEDLKEDLGY